MSRTYSDTLRDIAATLAEHEHGAEMLRAIADEERTADTPEEAGWITAEAVYYVASRWHRGQRCPLYSAGCLVRFDPGPLWRRPEPRSVAAYLATDLVRILRR